MKLKRNLAFVFFIVAGVIIGALIASAAEGLPFLGWLSYGKTVGIPTSDPLLLDLSLIRLAFACELGVNVAQIFTITGALILYKSVATKL